VAYEVTGSAARALVFVHGWSCDRTYWRAQIPFFAQRRLCVSVDLAGHGGSGDGRLSWTMRAFGEDVIAVVRQLALDDVILIGHSMGGDVIVEASLGLPERVAGLVWLDTYRALGQPIAPEEIAEIAQPFRQDFGGATRSLVGGMFRPDADSALVEWIVEDMAAAPPGIAIDALINSLANEGSAVDGIGRMAAPVVAINPDYWPTDVGSLQRYGVSTVLMPGVGHFPMMERPEAFNRLLAEVVDGFG
jgi:pimeloyl-ACP methyl ester carboxylesterase